MSITPGSSEELIRDLNQITCNKSSKIRKSFLDFTMLSDEKDIDTDNKLFDSLDNTKINLDEFSIFTFVSESRYSEGEYSSFLFDSKKNYQDKSINSFEEDIIFKDYTSTNYKDSEIETVKNHYESTYECMKKIKKIKNMPDICLENKFIDIFDLEKETINNSKFIFYIFKY